MCHNNVIQGEEQIDRGDIYMLFLLFCFLIKYCCKNQYSIWQRQAAPDINFYQIHNHLKMKYNSTSNFKIVQYIT